MITDLSVYRNEYEENLSQIERFLKAIKNQFDDILIDEKLI